MNKIGHLFSVALIVALLVPSNFTPVSYAAKVSLPQSYAVLITWPYKDVPQRSDLDSTFQKYGSQYNVDWVLLKAQAAAESRIGTMKNAVSHKGARGISQFMPATRQEYLGFGIDPWKSEDQGIKAQAHYMNRIGKTKGYDWVRTLAGYNWGWGSENKRGKDMSGVAKTKASMYPAETLDYIIKISRWYIAYGGNGPYRKFADAVLDGHANGEMNFSVEEVQTNCMADPAAFLTDADGIGTLENPDAAEYQDMSINEMIAIEGVRRLSNDDWAANVAKVSSRALWVDYLNATAAENFIARQNHEKRQNIEQLMAQYVSLKAQNLKEATTAAHNEALNNKVTSNKSAPSAANYSNGANASDDPWWKFW